MRIRNIKNAEMTVNDSKYIIKNHIQYKNKNNLIFGNDNPIRLEIGMGKGDFLINMAKKNPDINFIGVERYCSIIYRAVEKLELEDIPNIRILPLDALGLASAFGKEIDVIYLNFSDPWPKKRHAKRRLTSETFLKIYDQIYKDKKTIIQKTDNRGLFQYSLMSLTSYGYKIEELSLDLYSDDISDNVPTEYEKKFSSKGDRIYMAKYTRL